MHLNRNHSAVPMIALLVLAALVPAACVLWFMTVAMRNERLAVREQMAEVYFRQLTSVQRQVDVFWKERRTSMQSIASDSAAGKFAAIARANLADAAVVHDGTGKPLYPGTANFETPVDEKADWVAVRELEFQKKDYVGAAAAYAQIVEASRDIHTKARALQSEATCRLKAGDTTAALARLSQLAGDGSLRNATSAQRTLIAPNAQLLLLQWLGAGPVSLDKLGTLKRDGLPAPVERASGSPAGVLRERTLENLVSRLNDYSAPNFPAAQRRFLMREVNALESPASRLLQNAAFPTLVAEELAAEYLESNPPMPLGVTLERTPLPKIWRLASGDRTVVALYREARLKAEMEQLFASLALPDVQIRLLAPGEPFVAGKLVPPLEAGEFFPGWRLALSFRDGDPFAEASARQMRFYLWTGFLVVVIIALLALLVARYVSAQMRLARLKNELVSTVSHELKTPLASMRALVDTLSAGRYHDEQQLRDYLNLIARENQRLGHLIENFLTFSRLERGRQRYHFESIAPHPVVATAANALREKLESPDCVFEMHVSAHLPGVRADADALTAVLINLLDNAYKYTGEQKRITIGARANGESVCFEVTDNGIGLGAGETRKIFDRFYQVDQSLTRQRGGCGLGLSIVQSIVRAHGGTVEVESEPGKGSTFRVRIPIAATESSGELSSADDPKPVHHGTHG
ncbi:MAG: HAMP domain-containing sensor histidine kinase [Opitutaceae bacterium]|nr:HAMP domain-containing sensor histidine kinase [Opitutaceae bacterium]